jgi:hypothetical protein
MRFVELRSAEQLGAQSLYGPLIVGESRARSGRCGWSAGSLRQCR